jgi:hypothetical protein
MNDSEWDKIEFAQKSRHNRTYGFQGCANLNKGCDFNGFYLCTYSPEGLCEDCELKQFPERFYGCCFCRRAIRYGRMCYNCDREFSKWLDLVFLNHENKDWRFRQTVEQGIYRLMHHDHKAKKLPFLIQQQSKYNDKWPGFHLGDLKWIMIDPILLRDKIDISDIKWDDSREVLERELKKVGISLYEEIQFHK